MADGSISATSGSSGRRGGHEGCSAAACPSHKGMAFSCVVGRQRTAVNLMNLLFHSFGSGLISTLTRLAMQLTGRCQFAVQEGYR